MNEIDREAPNDYCRWCGNLRDWCDDHIERTHGACCKKCTHLDSTDAQLAALRDERDRAVRVLKILVDPPDGTPCMGAYSDISASSVTVDSTFPPDAFAPGDFDWLRHLIESEEGQ